MKCGAQNKLQLSAISVTHVGADIERRTRRELCPPPGAGYLWARNGYVTAMFYRIWSGTGHTIDDYLGCEAVQGREFACKDWRTCIYSKLISSRCHFHSTRSRARFNIQSGHGPPPGSWQLFAVCLHRRTFDRGARPSYMQPT